MFVDVDGCKYNTNQIIKISAPMTFGGAEGDTWSVTFDTTDDAVSKKFDTEAEALAYIEMLTNG